MNSFNLQDHDRRTPYRVPDGYFDSLTSRVMQSLPDADTQAANRTAEGGRIRIDTASTAYDEDYEQQVLDYAMLDEQDIYAYMSGGI